MLEDNDSAVHVDLFYAYPVSIFYIENHFPLPPLFEIIFFPLWIKFDEFFLFFNYPKFWVIFQLFFALISLGSKYYAFFLPHFLVTF